MILYTICSSVSCYAHAAWNYERLYNRGTTLFFTLSEKRKTIDIREYRSTLRLLTAMLAVKVFLLFLATASECWCYVVHGESGHRITIDCGDPRALDMKMIQCGGYLYQLFGQGFPWSGISPNITYERGNNGSLKDALDSLDYVCETVDRTRRCLRENNIHGYCLLMNKIPGLLDSMMYFEVICRKRDENVVHSLQCLRDKKVLSTLYFNIAQQCDFDILDDLMVHYRNAYFYTLDILPLRANPSYVPGIVYCLPKTIISTCIGQIIEDQCGLASSVLVQKSFLYLQDRLRAALESAGLDTDICHHDPASSGKIQVTSPNIPPSMSSSSKETAFARFLDEAAPGTALDTVYGQYLRSIIWAVNAEKLCFYLSYYTFRVCLMAADDKLEKPKFNILQEAHQGIPVFYHGSQCQRRGVFKSCWNLFQQICGRQAIPYATHADLMVGGCEIQEKMDRIGCHWQDMLIGHYIEAMRQTSWKINNPMCLQDLRQSLNGTRQIRDLIQLISFILPGVEEIRERCGAEPAAEIRSFIQRLNYTQLDTAKYAITLEKKWG